MAAALESQRGLQPLGIDAGATDLQQAVATLGLESHLRAVEDPSHPGATGQVGAEELLEHDQASLEQ
jgi:hypothetical protein